MQWLIKIPNCNGTSTSRVERMEYATGIILAQTVVVCIISTIAIMWCFFEEEPRKQKMD